MTYVRFGRLIPLRSIEKVTATAVIPAVVLGPGLADHTLDFATGVARLECDKCGASTALPPAGVDSISIEHNEGCPLKGVAS